jgi:hypothetical protein
MHTTNGDCARFAGAIAASFLVQHRLECDFVSDYRLNCRGPSCDAGTSEFVIGATIRSAHKRLHRNQRQRAEQPPEVRGHRVAPEEDRGVRIVKRVLFWSLCLGVLGATLALYSTGRARSARPPVVNRIAYRPVIPAGLDAAPPHVQDFLHRVLEKLPAHGAGVASYQFSHWEWENKPTREVVGLKPVTGVNPSDLIKRVMDVDGYQSHITHVVGCRSKPDPDFAPPMRVRFHQVIRVPRIANVQQELVLVDAGIVKGYRVAYWYLLKDKTDELDPKLAARSDYNVGAWLVAPGVVGYALSTWPQREDVNAFQWATLTSGADAMAKKVIETNIDSMAAWADKASEATTAAN